jgi:hypothetical protein
MKESSFERIPASSAYLTFRSTAYSSDKALAELVDNSIQAGAHHVRVILSVAQVENNIRRSLRVNEIYVCDDGCGMDQELLTRCIGISVSENKHDENGIGKFGWGLIGSTLSQARRIDIWSWQDFGVNSSNHTYLDLDDDNISGYLYEAEPRTPPDHIIDIFSSDTSNNGTVVRWSKLDKLDWKKASTVADKTSEILGRLYRYKLVNPAHELQISFTILEEGVVKETFYVKPTDPLYIMGGSIETTCPSPFANQPMFREIEDKSEDIYTIDEEYGEASKHPITIRYSLVREEVYVTEDGKDAGRTPHGKHANRNKGVSLVRAERELLIDDDWCNDPRDRWWGIEVLFHPCHDELFGVGKDKQSASNYQEIAHAFKKYSGDPESWQAYKEDFEVGSSKYIMIGLVDRIAQVKGILFPKIRNMRRGARGGKSPGNTNPISTAIDQAEIKATQALNECAKETIIPGLDDVVGDPLQLANDLANQIMADTGQETKEATELATQILFDKRKLKTIEFCDEGNAFFSVGDQSGVILLKINREHEFHSELYQNLVDDPMDSFDSNISEAEQIQELKSRLSKATRALILTFSSWARMEYDFINTTPDMKTQLRTIRQQWGTFLRKFLKD